MSSTATTKCSSSICFVFDSMVPFSWMQCNAMHEWVIRVFDSVRSLNENERRWLHSHCIMRDECGLLFQRHCHWFLRSEQNSHSESNHSLNVISESILASRQIPFENKLNETFNLSQSWIQCNFLIEKLLQFDFPNSIIFYENGKEIQPIMFPLVVSLLFLGFSFPFSISLTVTPWYNTIMWNGLVVYKQQTIFFY